MAAAGSAFEYQYLIFLPAVSLAILLAVYGTRLLRESLIELGHHHLLGIGRNPRAGRGQHDMHRQQERADAEAARCRREGRKPARLPVAALHGGFGRHRSQVLSFGLSRMAPMSATRLTAMKMSAAISGLTMSSR